MLTIADLIVQLHQLALEHGGRTPVFVLEEETGKLSVPRVTYQPALAATHWYGPGVEAAVPFVEIR